MRKVLTGSGPDDRSTILADEPVAEPAPGQSRAATETRMTPTLPPEFPYVRSHSGWRRPGNCLEQCMCSSAAWASDRKNGL